MWWGSSRSIDGTLNVWFMHDGLGVLCIMCNIDTIYKSTVCGKKNLRRIVPVMDTESTRLERENDTITQGEQFILSFLVNDSILVASLPHLQMIWMNISPSWLLLIHQSSSAYKSPWLFKGKKSLFCVSVLLYLNPFLQLQPNGYW